MNQFIINSLIAILNTYQSMSAYFYQRINQTQYSNSQLAISTPQYVNGILVKGIDYSYLLPSSEFILVLNENQVNAQIQSYIDLCNALVKYLTTNVNTQTNLFYEQIQNQLNSSITNINGFAVSLLEAQYATIFVFDVPYDMSMSYAMFLNNIDLNTYTQQAQLNSELQDFNNIRQNTQLILSR